MESFTEAWGLVCGFCKACITEMAYTTWIYQIRPVSLGSSKRVVVLEAPNGFHLRTLTQCYTSLLQEAFNEVSGKDIQIQLCTLEQLVQNKKLDAVPLSKGDYEYTFNTFIVGSSNKFTYVTSTVTTTKPVILYNPLFIYGNLGLGRTHFLYATCNGTLKNYPQMSIIYIKGDEFISELTETIRRGTIAEFHQCYREMDTLLADGTQFVINEGSTQEEFFHTFNTLYEAEKQIMLTSDRPPEDITTLEERLLTCFGWGLIADVPVSYTYF